MRADRSKTLYVQIRDAKNMVARR